MSIRDIAKELYRLAKVVDRLETEFETAPPEERVLLEEKLRKAKAERDAVRRILDGRKGM
jgi:hypothetical protein